MRRRVILFAMLCASCSGNATENSAGSDAAADTGIECETLGFGSMHFDVSPTPTSDGGTDGYDWSASGVVTASWSNTFTIDTCSPSGDPCTPAPSEVHVTESASTPGLDLVIPVGAYVSVHAIHGPSWYGGRNETLSVKNLAMWNGMTNPVSTDDDWYLLASEAVLEHPDAPFEASATKRACDSALAYDLAFFDAGSAPNVIPVGDVTSLTLAGQSWDARVVREHTYECCDYPPPYAWWFARPQP